MWSLAFSKYSLPLGRAAGSNWLGAEMDGVGEARSDERVEISLAALRAGAEGLTDLGIA
jgi:hypothetical protein